MRIVVLAGSVAMLAACQQPAETPEQANARIASESAAAKTAIDSLNNQFAMNLSAGNADALMAAYTDNPVLMPPNGPAAKGRDAVKTTFTEVLFPLKPELKLTAEAVTANGDLAVERGIYTLTMTPPGAPAPVTETGKYLVHWHRVGGKWLIADDIWNSDQPAPGIPPRM